MAQPSIKTSFASGEWAPKLRSRVDIQKYHSGAALLRNFYVDYSGGGASTRQGTRFINQCKANGARLIPFQPSSNLSYVLEFGQNYIRFFSNGAPIVEAATVITGITNANPGVVTDVAHGYTTGDWIWINNVIGMGGLNGSYFIVTVLTANTYTLSTLAGVPVNTTSSGTYTSDGTAQRVYTITSPYSVGDLFPNPLTGNPGIKWVQNVTSLIITHPSHEPVVLTINSATSWTLVNASFGPSIGSPTGLASGGGTNLGAGTWFYGYLVTAVDINGQESGRSTPIVFSSLLYLGTTVGTIQTTWTAVTGAVSYNVYKALPVNGSVPSAGAQYGFVGNVTTAVFNDSYPGIIPDFSQTPPIVENPFAGPGVTGYNVTTAGTYTTVPGVIVAAPPVGGQTATATASLGITVVGSITHATGNQDILTTGANPNGSLLTFTNGIVLSITGTTLIGTGGGHSFWEVTSVSATPVSAGSITSGATPTNPVSPSSCTVPGFFGFNGSGGAFGISFTWGVKDIFSAARGSGYVSAPAVSFSTGGAAAVAILGPASAGNPGVPGFIQERLAFAGSSQAIQSFNFSQPGSFFNFNISNPSQDDDAISGTIIAEELNDIRWLLPVPTGILAGTGKGAWLINGGGGISTQVPITPANATAQPQSFNGANDLRPIKINSDALYATNKGNYIRSLSYSIYTQLFTGSDISVLSNHLFFGYYLPDWCWAEEPFKTVWAIRNDGQMLSLGYVKEQELIGWAHHDTNGRFKSTCSVIETVNGNVVDAVYFIVERLAGGTTPTQYVERMADRYFPYGYEDSWSVDCALQTVPNGGGLTTSTIATFNSVNTVGASVTISFSSSVGLTSFNIGNVIRASGGIFTITSVVSPSQVIATVNQVATNYDPYLTLPNPDSAWTLWIPTSTVSGLTQLIGQSVVGVADGVAVGPYTVSVSGTVALGLTATKVTLGLAFLPQLQTLPLDLGEPTVQGKRKKITGLTLRVADTLGLQVGKTFATVVAMKDFTLGNVPTTSTGVARVTDLVSGDGRTIIDQEWDTAGNYCIQQNLPYPATILGVMPETTVGDGK